MIHDGDHDQNQATKPIASMLEEITAEKKRCEECIQAVIDRFIRRTGLSVYGIKQESITFTEWGGKETVRLTLIKLDIRL